MSWRTRRARTLIVLLALNVLVTASYSKDKKRDWQTGKLISIEAGIPESSPGIITQGTAVPLVLHAQYKVWIYTVETETMIYGFSARSQKPRPLTINSEVKFAFQPKGDVFLLDEKGKEFKASVVKQTARQQPH
jgi:hypothetical protein